MGLLVETGVQGLAFFWEAGQGQGRLCRDLGHKSPQNAVFLLIQIEMMLKLAAQASLVYNCCRQL